ncbi:choline ABC transporter ATP-binding protein [Brevirhabdus pacifica]|uniref:Choline ABC transporter ATP-binding protein n=1 Tax=Brevirhabdus pacifica TaxID=1267768 RepID=A0A1U7DG98_9RHOB|nr:choline ABC transporter ATP-binding protein [Brevirhabdus pacifica]APX88965.1 choline ABC transporter ATP-binding protein [Brevirhabdus pacifica]OWU80187.1 hemolysin [Loktanella sp. 22II-4b]PJJ86479.1 glycine betaine/proline transport system ATP-binding protein [Brevirhabdus pacifica]
MSAVIFDNVSIVFGEHPERALPLMDQGLSRSEIQERTGQVLGVHDCSLQVAEGEILVLMGLSGSGKSTLLRAVNGLNPVSRGEVRVRRLGPGSDGQEEGAEEMTSVTHADRKTLRELRLSHIAMVFQQFGLLPWRSVRENVGLGLELGGMLRARRNEQVERQLDLVGLSDWADRKVGELSGGMQQRVGLARAFATDAPILLMDEPFSALDPLIRTRLQDELLELQQKLNRTIIFVSHDLDEAFKLGNRIAIMEGGRIVQCGTPQQIFSDPASDYVADFVAHMNPLGVLCARDVMEPATGTPSVTVPPEEDIRRVMEQVTATGAPVGVVDDGRLLGQITRDTVLNRILDPRNG